jgi:putative membrane protein
MLWIKALHIIFVISWMAGTLYLPRLFVYHVDTRDQAGHDRFCLMERRLYALTTIGMIGTWIFGISLLLMTPGYMQMGWLHAKLTLVLALSGYHGWMKGRLRAFAEQRNDKSARYYRVANEIPALGMVAIVIFVVVKPF